MVQSCSLSHLSPHKKDTFGHICGQTWFPALRRPTSKTESFPARIRVSALQLTPINLVLTKQIFWIYSVSKLGSFQKCLDEKIKHSFSHSFSTWCSWTGFKRWAVLNSPALNGSGWRGAFWPVTAGSGGDAVALKRCQSHPREGGVPWSCCCSNSWGVLVQTLSWGGSSLAALFHSTLCLVTLLW